MTQALAFAEMLRRRGHAVVGAVVGAGRWGSVPDFFRRALRAPVETVESPGFVVSEAGTIRPAATLWKAVRQSARLSRSLDRVTAAVDRAEPDVVVSFYEALAGAHSLLRGADVPTVAVGHQFMMDHPAYPLQPGHAVQRTALRAYTALAGAGATRRLALSFYDAPDHGATVTPPLLRRGLFALADRPRDGSVLVYLMEPRMAPSLAAWERPEPRGPRARVRARRAPRPQHRLDVPRAERAGVPGADGRRPRRRVHGGVRDRVGGDVAGDPGLDGPDAGPLRAAVQRGRRRRGRGRRRGRDPGPRPAAGGRRAPRPRPVPPVGGPGRGPRRGGPSRQPLDSRPSAATAATGPRPASTCRNPSSATRP